MIGVYVFLFKQKTAYGMRISDWCSYVCSSDLQIIRDIAIGDPERQPLGDRGLADARFADQHWIVLGPPCEHLDGAADFLVAADDGIELAVARRLGQVAGEFQIGRASCRERVGQYV